MPIPKPNKNEKQQAFVSRCMANSSMNKEFPDQKQRSAVCFNTYKETQKNDGITIPEGLLYDEKLVQKTVAKEIKIPTDGDNKKATDISIGMGISNPTTVLNLEQTENRIDFLEIMPDFENDLTESFQVTDEGFLNGRAIITNIGVFPYLMPDGTVRKELRLPEEVFNKDSIDSIKNKILTNNHPVTADGLIDINNVKQFQVGFLGNSPHTDPFHISMPITVTDKQAVEDVQNGKRALSAGYTVQFEENPGVWMGVAYDGVQRNIRYNHVAIVDRGRAGDAARMRFDSAGYAVAVSADIQNLKLNEEDSMELKTIKLDGVEYKAEAEILKNLNQTVKRVDELQTEIEKSKTDSAKLEAERDTLQDKITSLEAELEKKTDEATIKAAVDKRVKILNAAEIAGIEVKDDMSETDIQKAVILKVSPKANLDERSEDYLNARFDGAVELLEETQENKADAKIREVGMDVSGENMDAGEIVNSDNARKKMIERQFKISRDIA